MYIEYTLLRKHYGHRKGLSKVPAQIKCFSKYFFTWFVPDELRDIIPKETSKNAGAKSLKISSKLGYEDWRCT